VDAATELPTGAVTGVTAALLSRLDVDADVAASGVGTALRCELAVQEVRVAVINAGTINFGTINVGTIRFQAVALVMELTVIGQQPVSTPPEQGSTGDEPIVMTESALSRRFDAVDDERLQRPDPKSLDRRTVLRAGFAAAIIGASGGGLVSCTRDARSDRANATSKVGKASASALPTTAGTGSAAVQSPSSQPAASPVVTDQASAVPTKTPAAQSAAPASTPGAPAIEITHGPASASGVALTFHGAGDVGLATKLLGELEAVGARVTVLAVGQWLDQEPAMAKRILDGGHELGNHTYRHLTMPQLTEIVDESEITRCADVLRRLTGSAGRWFRPSGTVHATPAILEAAGRAGYATSLSYDVDPEDYADPGAAAVTTRVLAAVRAGSIVSLHLGHVGTVQAMPAILDGLRSRSLPAVTMSDLMG
jgi:peptidoglycan/xylan/chitin deacetylase (PgdA/CDA1 family)